jgi:hypothetical protein
MAIEFFHMPQRGSAGEIREGDFARTSHQGSFLP